ncbi:MAG: sulfite exporter TauE/SafE family protein, partial [Anaerolineaceae bacterium]|nr:sulfite exporter TauE/SafE family protein [Anaerolineaceae bacterium]
MDILQYLIAAIGAFAAGAVNALAGGGTLITFPLLTALGLPAVTANITSTVSLFPGYFGATYAQRTDLKGQGKQLKWLLPAAAVGGLFGGLLLAYSGEKTFRQIVPFLILFASLLLALGEPLKKWVSARNRNQEQSAKSPIIAVVAIAAAAVYGGYFGAGLSVIVLAFLGLLFDDSLTRLNALKQAIA